MRVVSGKARGTKLFSLKTDEARPTADRIKEALFSMISEDIKNACVLDLFAGTGAIGIEALSRGAKETYFVENFKDCISIIKRNLEHTKLENVANIRFEDSFKAIEDFSKENIQFDLIYLDPPYNKGYTIRAVNDIIKFGILKDSAIIIAEQDSKEDLPNCKNTEIIKIKNYAKTKIIFIKKII